MPLPIELENEPEDTTIVGDIDALIREIESGQAREGWVARLQSRIRDMELL